MVKILVTRKIFHQYFQYLDIDIVDILSLAKIWILLISTVENEKGKVNQFDVANKKEPTQLQNQDVHIIQSQKTTEHNREPKQKQANGGHKW